MKFERTNIPVFTGVKEITKVIDKLGISKEYHIAAVRTGIPCLIINGSICDLSGNPFSNKELQSKFGWFAERMMNSNFIGIGKLYLRNEPTFRRTYNSEILSSITTNSFYFIKKITDMMLEVEDVYQQNSTEITFDVRLKIIQGMSRNIELSSTDITTQTEIVSDTNSIDEIIKFVVDNGKLGKRTSFRYLKSKYICGEQNIKELKVFEADPYEIFSGKIESVKSSYQEDIYEDKQSEMIDFIRVNVDGEKLSIGLLHMPISTNKRLLNAINSNLIDKYLFRAISYQGKRIYSTPL